MPHRDTGVVINNLYIDPKWFYLFIKTGFQFSYQQAFTLALNATMGHKRSYQQAITSALNATQGHKRSYQQAITLALNDTQGHKRSYQQAIGYLQALNKSLP